MSDSREAAGEIEWFDASPSASALEPDSVNVQGPRTWLLVFLLRVAACCLTLAAIPSRLYSVRASPDVGYDSSLWGKLTVHSPDRFSADLQLPHYGNIFLGIVVVAAVLLVRGIYARHRVHEQIWLLLTGAMFGATLILAVDMQAADRGSGSSITFGPALWLICAASGLFGLAQLAATFRA